jgi:hypothetical protein
MRSKKRFTVDEAANLLERAGKAAVVETEEDLSLDDVLDLARSVGIDPEFVQREVLRERHSDQAGLSSERGLKPIEGQSSRLHIYGDGDYLVMTADVAGWSRPIVARTVMWACVLGFVGYFIGRSEFTPVSVLATIPFAAWATWSTLRLISLARERTSFVLSRAAFSTRAVGPWSRRELTGDAGTLQVDEPRMARDPEGGVEVFPLYFLRLRTNAKNLDILHGHRESDLRRAYQLIKAWRARSVPPPMLSPSSETSD